MDKINNHNDQSPPIFKSWKTWYGIVILFLFFELILFYLIAGTFL